MDAIDTPTTDIVIVEDVDGTLETSDSFGKEITKTLAISAASTVGMIVGVAVLAVAVNKLEALKARRAAKKAEPKVHVVTDLPETPAEKTA